MIYPALFVLILATACRSAPASHQDCDAVLCMSVWMPVCGTDGKTYSNTCALDIATCKDPSVKLDHRGECGGNPFVNGRRATDCNFACMDLWDPICGTDGKTYSNKCELSRATCQYGTTVTFAKRGQC